MFWEKQISLKTNSNTQHSSKTESCLHKRRARQLKPLPSLPGWEILGTMTNPAVGEQNAPFGKYGTMRALK